MAGSHHPSHFIGASVAELRAAFDTGLVTSADYVSHCLARVEAYDRRGPTLRAALTLNDAALKIARARDAERLAGRVRSPLHGVPVLLKDNIDTADMPTTAGSVFLEGHRPQRDAALVTRLREAGVIVLGKANMSEFALSQSSSLAGRPKNPHDLARATIGSSSGSAVAVAACYAPIALGTDTGGSIRGPASAVGVVGLKPTHGLLDDSGIVPFARSLDVAGPMARSVADLALCLEVLGGAAIVLQEDALCGARIGIARDFTGFDRDVDWVLQAAIDAMQRAGATLIDVRFPKWLLESKQEFYLAIRHREFKHQIADYLAATGAGFPKTLADLVDRARRFTAPHVDGAQPNPGRWAVFDEELASGSLEDSAYRLATQSALPMIRRGVEELFADNALDAIAYLPMPVRPPLLTVPESQSHHGAKSPTNIANLTGFPDLTVPAGFTSDGLPVGLSFLGRARSEARLLSLGHDFEQETRAIRLPVHTPALDFAT